MREKLLELKKSIDTSKKTKKIMGFVALFIMAILPSVILISYSHYATEDSNLILDGTAKIESGDIILKVYLQNRDSSGNPSSGYTRVYFIPQKDYSYNGEKSACTNGVTINGFTDNKFNITASKRGVCEVYFDALASDNIQSNPNGTFRIFAEQTKGEGDYVEVGKVPGIGYAINEAKTSETCSNVTLTGTTINVTASGNVACVIYLDKADVETGNIVLKIYLQDRDASGNPLSTYTREYYIPQSGYNYNSEKSACTNGLTIDSFTNNKFNITASRDGTCEVYFDADANTNIKSSPNGSFKIFAEQTKGAKDYIEVGKVPDANYVINQAKTGETCPNVTLNGTTLNITASSNVACQIYLDKK